MADYRVTLTYEVDAYSEAQAVEIARDYAEGDMNVAREEGALNKVEGLEFKAERI